MEKPKIDSIEAILMDFIGEVGIRHLIPLETVKKLMDRIVEIEQQNEVTAKS